MRFVLEYYAASSFDIVKNIVEILKPGGIVCLIDLDPPVSVLVLTWRSVATCDPQLKM